MHVALSEEEKQLLSDTPKQFLLLLSAFHLPVSSLCPELIAGESMTKMKTHERPRDTWNGKTSSQPPLSRCTLTSVPRKTAEKTMYLCLGF